MNANRRVCFLLPSFWKPIMGGAQYQAMVLAQRMIELKKFDIHYLTRRFPENHVEPEVTLHRIGRSKGMYFLFDAPGVLTTLRQLEPQVIYAHVGSAYVGIAAYYCRTNNCSLVWHIASDIDVEPWSPHQRRNLPASFIDKKIMEYGLRRADHIVVQSQVQADLLLKHYKRRASATIKNFHPPVAESLEKESELTVLWVANLKDVKQPEEFVKLANHLRHLPVRFQMLGGMQLDAAREKALLSMIEKTENCSYLGPVSQEEVNRRLSAAHLLVNTSSYEGFSNTFIQAWQRKVPVCSLNVNPDNLLKGLQLGSYAEGDPEKLSEQVESFLKDKQKRLDCGERASAYAAEHHSIAAADRLLELLL